MAKTKKPRERKTRSDAKLKNLARTDQETLWRLMHPTDSTVPAYTPEDAMVYVQGEHGISVSETTLYEWHSWYALNLRMEARENAANQLMEDMARNPENSEEQIRKAGQRLFMAEGIVNKDFRQFSGAAKMATESTKLQQAEKKIALLKKAGARDERKLAILEAKAAQADAAGAVAHDGKLTDAEKAAELKRIFRMG